MKYHLTIIYLFFTYSLFSQVKGVSPIEGGKGAETNQTYAVVVGISDYQDEGIPDLRFADKDAEAFAAFLQSPAGGSLDEGHLRILTNEEATMAQFAMALDWLMEVVKEGDKALIYFSGHGDVEKKSFIQPGFLLCWDAPPKIYMAGGSFSILLLQDVIASLSLGNKAEVILVTDACRSGKLSGSTINGPQLTSSNLAKQLSNEVKILSCQSNEYSIEGEQWGGGRGAFSYHLVNGLYGMADRNADLQVNLSEIDRYLEDHVTPEVAPISQIPLVLGNKTTRLSQVDEAILADLDTKIRQNKTFGVVDSKGLEADVLAAADSSIQQLYAQFQKYLKDEVFLEPADASADYCYRLLVQEPSLEPLHSTMRRNFAAALQDKAQQFMNALLNSDAKTCYLEAYSAEEELYENIAYLDRSIEILGNDHYMMAILQSFRHFFQGLAIYLKATIDEEETGKEQSEGFQKSLEKYHAALRYQPEMPQAWLQMAIIFGENLYNYDSAFHYAELALDAVPNWLFAQIVMARIFDAQSDSLNASVWRKKIWQTDSVSDLTLTYLAGWHYDNGQMDEAAYYFKKTTEQGTGVFCDYMFLGGYYMDRAEFVLAEEVILKAIELDVNNGIAYSWLAEVYLGSRQNDKAEEALKKSTALEEKQYAKISQTKLANLYFSTKQYEKSIAYWEGSIAQDPTADVPYLYLGLSYLLSGKYEKAEKAILEFLANDHYEGLLLWDYGRIFLKHNQFTAAEAMFKKMAEKEDDNPNHYLHLGLVYLKQNRFEEAAQKFHDAEVRHENLDRLDGYTTSPFWARYIMYMKQGLEEKALEELEKGMQLGPDYLGRSMGFYMIECDLFSANGTLLYEKIMEKYPENSMIHFQYARYLLGQEETNSAYGQLKIALEKGFTDFKRLKRDIPFQEISQEDERWKTLIKKYFPEKFED